MCPSDGFTFVTRPSPTTTRPEHGVTVTTVVQPGTASSDPRLWTREQHILAILRGAGAAP